MFWIIVTPFVIALAVVTIVDIVRHHYGRWQTAAWVLVVICLPLIGSIVYWVARKAGPGDAEHAYLAEADRRSQLQRHPTDRSGF